MKKQLNLAQQELMKTKNQEKLARELAAEKERQAKII